MSDLNVKVGDKVIVSSRWSTDYVCTVDAITPKGFIKVDSVLYNKNGSKRGGDRYSYISVATSDTIQKYNESRFIKMMLNKMHNIEDIDYSQALEISKILAKEEKKQ